MRNLWEAPRYPVFYDPGTISIIGAIGGLASGAAGIAGALKKAPKAPAPVAGPPVPTVNDARRNADQAANQNNSKGMLANMLSPVNAAGSTNPSLKQLLGQ